jgi:hypothetical protein
VQRATRLIVLASTLLAAVAHGWLAQWQPLIAPAAFIAFIVTFAAARYRVAYGMAIAAASAYVAPATLWLAFGAADYHIMLVWLAAVAGPVFATARWDRWSLPVAWRFPLTTWALVIALSWPVIAAREVDFNAIAATTLQGTNAAFGAPPPIAAAFVIIAALAQLLGILWADLLWRHFGEDDSAFRRLVFPAFIASATASCLAGIYQAGVDITWINPHIWSNLQRAGGLALDANTLGMGAALWAPAALVLAWRTRRSAWLPVAAFVVLAGGMWTSDSRTAFLAFVAGSVAFLVAFLKARALWRPRVARGVVGACVTLLVLAVAFVPRDHTSSNPVQRAFARVPTLDANEIARFADELWVRFGYGRAAAVMFVDHPVTGIGIGAFHVVAPDYILRDTGRLLAADNAQNWWRHQIAELGLVGALPSVWFSLLLLMLVLRRTPDHEATVLRGTIAGIGLASLVGVPTQHPATLLSVATLAFWLGKSAGLASADASVFAREPHARLAAVSWATAIALALVVLIGVTATAVGELRVARRALRAGVPYSYGVSAVEGLSADQADVRRVAERAAWVFPIAHRWLQLTMWPPHTDATAQPVHVRLTVNETRTVEHTFRDRTPVTLFLEMPQERFALIDTAVSRGVRRDYALDVATSWKRELPADAAADRVLTLTGRIQQADAVRR